jgi:SAM-dependent methyltransferase
MKSMTTDDILELLDASFTSAALGTAMELGLFWLLDQQPLEAMHVAEKLGIPAKRCSYWLQLLSKAGLLDHGSSGYAPSPAARHTILDSLSQNSWAHLAGEARERLPGLCDLTANIREPGSAWDRLGLTQVDYVEQMTDDPLAARRFTRMLYELHQPLAAELARLLDMQDVDRFMDIGGGSGVVSLALLRRHPHLTAVVTDIEAVCASGQEIAAENFLEDRITYQAVDFLREELPADFDLILECDVNVYSENLFHKVHTALNPDGRFVIVDQLATAVGTAPSSRVHWAFERSMIDPEFHFLTADEIEAWLLETGFKDITLETLPPIPSKADRFSEEMVLLVAHK